jgi:hypothetical protein
MPGSPNSGTNTSTMISVAAACVGAVRRLVASARGR